MSQFSRPQPFSTGGQIMTAGTFGAFAGLVVLDTSGAANQISIYDGTSAAGTLVCSIDVPAGKSGNLAPKTPRVFVNGLFAVCTGSVKASVFIS